MDYFQTGRIVPEFGATEHGNGRAEYEVGATEQGKSSPFPCWDAPNSSTIGRNLRTVAARASLNGAYLGTGVPKWMTV